MASFSERFGYVKPIEIVRKEEIQTDLVNALCTCYDLLANDIHRDEYEELEKYLWIDFLYKRYSDFYQGYRTVMVLTSSMRHPN